MFWHIFLNTEMAVLMLRLEHKATFILHSKYHYCWCLGYVQRTQSLRVKDGMWVECGYIITAVLLRVPDVIEGCIVFLTWFAWCLHRLSFVGRYSICWCQMNLKSMKQAKNVRTRIIIFVHKRTLTTNWGRSNAIFIIRYNSISKT